MRLYFQLHNSADPLVASIAVAINEIYPIGLKIDTDGYNAYPGIQKKDALVKENMTKHNSFQKPWKEFLAELKKSMKWQIQNTSYAHEHSFSANVILERYQDDALLRTKKLIFVVSLLAPFFSIFGVDETTIKDEINGHQIGYSTINVVTVSAYKEFKDIFLLVNQNLEEKFQGYQLIPFNKCMCYVEGLSSLDGKDEDCTVYNALFNNFFNNAYQGYTRGYSLHS